MVTYTQISFLKLLKTIFTEQTSNISYDLLLLGILAVIVIVHTVCLIFTKVKKRQIKLIDEILLICLLSYICVLISITFLNREDGSRGNIILDLTVTKCILKSLRLCLNGHSSLSFGKTLMVCLSANEALTSYVYYILNILLFIPWGIILAFIHYKESLIKCFIMPIIYSIITSGCIEIVQLITGRGYFELEDLITNVFGGFVGAIIGILILLPIKYIKKNGGKYGNK